MTVIKSELDWAHIARDGKSLGYVPADKLQKVEWWQYAIRPIPVRFWIGSSASTLVHAPNVKFTTCTRRC